MRAVIAGAGIAGLTAALAFRRMGFDVSRLRTGVGAAQSRRGHPNQPQRDQVIASPTDALAEFADWHSEVRAIIGAVESTHRCRNVSARN
jgi:thioredoxin reductase